MTINVPDNEQMELVYLYVEKANDEEYDLHLDFSQDIQIRWDKDKKEFSIKELDNSLPKNFFGNNIANVTAIAGKNGSGKSSIMNILGGYRSQRRYDLEKNRYIIVYRITDEFFLIECINFKLHEDEFVSKENIYIGYYDSAKKDFKLIRPIDNTQREKFCYLSWKKHPLLKEHEEAFDSFVLRLKTMDTNNLIMFDYIRSEEFKRIFKFSIGSQNINITIQDVLKHGLDDYLDPNNMDRSTNLIINKIQEYVGIKNEVFTLNLVSKIHTCNKTEYILNVLRVIFVAFLEGCLHYNNVHSDQNNKKVDLLAIDQNINLKDSELLFNKSEMIRAIQFMDSKISELFHSYQSTVLQKDRYFFHIQELIDLLEKIDTSFFITDTQISITNNSCDHILKDLYQRIDEFSSNYTPLKTVFMCEFGKFSEGEKQLIESYSVIAKGLIEIQENKYKVVYLLLDEVEAHLHPEWSRLYLSYLLKFLQAFRNIRFQVILTTHSPYLISDLPKENIILLEKNEKTGKRTARKSNYGFASNYYDIMSDNFFLDDTIGEFAKQKINGCIQAINRISDDLDKLANDELILHDGLSLFIEESLETIEEQNKIIDLVGDKFIQKQLQQLLDSVKQRLLVHSDDSVRKQQLEQDIAELEERIRQKKMELNND